MTKGFESCISVDVNFWPKASSWLCLVLRGRRWVEFTEYLACSARHAATSPALYLLSLFHSFILGSINIHRSF